MMSLCRVFLFVALVAICLVVRADAMMEIEDITPERADVIFMCQHVIVCHLRRAYEMRRIALKTGPELNEKAIGWLADCYTLDTSDMEEFWATYADKVCNQSLELGRECTKQAMLNFAIYYEENCEDKMTPVECTKAEEALTELMLVHEEYTLSGDCDNPEETMVAVGEEMGEKTQKNAEEMEEEFEGMAKNFPKPPNFG